jgi:hypothetical protein
LRFLDFGYFPDQERSMSILAKHTRPETGSSTTLAPGPSFWSNFGRIG